ncbi:twin-arginine translocation signal domain-containing protein [Rufibacter latericius]|uniref:Twin-arginine translocation signal domain-containing protein n=1 Tax=Rufibacter latericius TaxID=2487040 RepID=A0A3M9MJB3_9BACT|nr:twin-arginine translocation signal domain-containing protein [Rufibacter latericius]RNI25594.1 twin-arginine translocation signal domain-containing protein [Rufibacter latericius]
MNRRNFLRLTGLAGAAMVALPSLGFMSTSIKEAAIGVITKELSYLKLDRKGVEQFVDDYFKTHYINNSLKTQINLKSCYYLGVNANDSRLLSKLVHNYITCTDFFINRMDESKTVKYMGLNKSYKMPCNNPFSSFYYPTTSV